MPPRRRQPSRGLLIYLTVCAVIALLAYAGYRNEQASKAGQGRWTIDELSLHPSSSRECLRIRGPKVFVSDYPGCWSRTSPWPLSLQAEPILDADGLLLVLGTADFGRPGEGTRVVDTLGRAFILQSEDGEPTFTIVADGYEYLCTSERVVRLRISGPLCDLIGIDDL